MLKEIRLLSPDPKHFHVAYEVAKNFVYLPTDQSEVWVPLAHYRGLSCRVSAAGGVMTVALTERTK